MDRESADSRPREAGREPRCSTQPGFERFQSPCPAPWEKELGRSSAAPRRDDRKSAASRPGPRVEIIGEESHRDILRLQGLNALGDIAVVDVAAVDVHEMTQGGSL